MIKGGKCRLWSYFDNEAEAAKVYYETATKYHDKHAELNLPIHQNLNTGG